MDIKKIPVEKLNYSKYNPRKNLKPEDDEYKKLLRSIKEFGYVEPIIWNLRTGNIVGGHQRYKILVELGYKEIDCVVVDLDEQKEKALNIALNKIQGEFDFYLLNNLIEDLSKSNFDISLTGFDKVELEKLFNKIKNSEEDNFDVDKTIETIENPITKKGDIWILGNHKLLCGDSRNEKDFEKLMNGCRAQMSVTSPPYGVGKEYEKQGIEEWFKTIRPVIKNLCKYANVVCWNIGDLVNTNSQFIEPTGVYSVNMFLENDYRPIWIRIWKKQGLTFSANPFHLVTNKPVGQYEYIFAFADKNYKYVRRLSKEEQKDWGNFGIWEINTVKANKEHPAMFPVEIPFRCIKMHSNIGDIILEPFCGSGTTIIAAEQSERRCYAIELFPKYCDVAVRRWEKYTGKKAVKI